MSTDAGRQHEMELALKSLINVLQDSQKGLADLGQHLQGASLKHYVLAESLQRANFRAELENELHRAGVHDVHETGTAAGTLRRIWSDLKTKVVHGDHALLETAEQAEDIVKEAYASVLAHETLPLPLRELLVTHQSHILTSHDYLREQRDVVAAK